jgi:hypothetical protein
MIFKLYKQKKVSASFFKSKQYFCKNKDYFSNKKLKQVEETQILFKHDESKLKQLNINLKQLAPNFFTKNIVIKES